MTGTGRAALRWLSIWMIGATVVATLLAAPAWAQGSEDDPTAQVESEAAATDQVIQILDVEEAEDGTVTVQVAIPGLIGELEPPLEQNFAVILRRTRYDVERAVKVETAVDVIVVIDTSQSMSGEPLRDAKTAATTFIDELPAGARIGVIGFGETVDVMSAPSLDRATALTQINGLQAVGETALWDALVESAQVAASTRADGGLTYVIVLADGDNSLPGTTQDDAVMALRESGVGLYAIAIRSAESNGEQLQQVAESAGGIFTTAETSAELENLYESIAQRLASRYELTFNAGTNEGGDLVISVARGEAALATARTRLQGATPSSTVVDEPDGPALVLNVPEGATLGTVGAPRPGAFGSPVMLPIGAAAVFLALALLGILMINPEIEVRLDTPSGADRLAGVNQRLSALADMIIARRDQDGELDKALDAAGIHLRPGEFTLMSLVVVIFFALLGWFAAGTALGLIMAAVSTVSVLAYLGRRAEKRRQLFAEQLIDTLSILVGSLRAGRGLPQALDLVADEAPSPTAEQFKRIKFETQVGRDVTESMLSVAERMKSQDFEWVARAIDINRELGGDLTEVLGNVSNTVRDRRRVARMVQSLSAEGRASGWVLIALPILMFIFTSWRTPENVSLLIDTGLGRTMLAIAAVGIIVGYLWIRKLVDIRY